MRIPLAFNTFLKSESPGVISLKGPSGNIWSAKLVLDSGRLCFVNGWKEFSIDHHLESGDFLVFSYDGHSQFSVLVFDKTECAKKSAIYACPGSTVVVESENAVLGIDANDTSHCYVGHNEGSYAIDPLQYDELALCIDGTKTAKVTENDRSINGTHAYQHDTQENGSLQKLSGSLWKAKNRLSGDSFYASRDAAIMGTDSDDTSEYYESANEENNATGHLQGNGRTMANYIKQGKGIIDEADPTSALPRLKERKRELADIFEFLDKLPKSSQRTRGRRSKDQFGTSKEAGSNRLHTMKAVAKVHESKVFISHRGVIAEKDKVNTLKGATRLHSNYPFTLQIMKACNVSLSFFMDIPSEFVRNYLPKANVKMTLWNRQGKPWEVNYVYRKSLGAFRRGRGTFVKDNNIEKDDICLFELFQENNMKVGIFRVVQGTTPSTPMLK